MIRERRSGLRYVNSGGFPMDYGMFVGRFRQFDLSLYTACDFPIVTARWSDRVGDYYMMRVRDLEPLLEASATGGPISVRWPVALLAMRWAVKKSRKMGYLE